MLRKKVKFLSRKLHSILKIKRQSLDELPKAKLQCQQRKAKAESQVWSVLP